MKYTIDAKNRKLGRLASEIAVILQGKNNTNYEKRNEGDDEVIVKNINELEVSGRKAEQKIYYRHTGYIGHLKEKKYKDAFKKDPAWVLRHAVKGMLPKNLLQGKRLKRLIIERKEE